MLAHNYQHLKFINVKNEKDFSLQPNQISVAALEQTILKLQKNQIIERTQSQVTLVLDTSKKDIGVLIRLNQLQKRLAFIKYVTGEWKPVSTILTMIIVEQVQEHDSLDRVRAEENGVAGCLENAVFAGTHEASLGGSSESLVQFQGSEGSWS